MLIRTYITVFLSKNLKCSWRCNAKPLHIKYLLCFHLNKNSRSQYIKSWWLFDPGAQMYLMDKATSSGSLHWIYVRFITWCLFVWFRLIADLEGNFLFVLGAPVSIPIWNACIWQECHSGFLSKSCRECQLCRLPLPVSWRITNISYGGKEIILVCLLVKIRSFSEFIIILFPLHLLVWCLEKTPAWNILASIWCALVRGLP